ncbi:sphingomyelin synthase-related protein 1-like [Saccoglossus kowalevskii]|uniref:Sphingomyelin synthase-related protein 1-like n=1 Tax=Saccoglossus kowalevskii TaxID=10224 RepID=A0ABM0GUD6_SACKO|nr:PREDICTED: sphingomyelin synthase-related protein 1-like [Saccoglossus kowalevskii]
MVDGPCTHKMDRWTKNIARDDTVLLIPMQHVESSVDAMTAFEKPTPGNHGMLAANGAIPGKIRTSFEPERWKTVMSLIYIIVASYCTTFIESVVHDRMPDAQVHPPLPDLILDNVPITPWAGTISEGIVVLLVCMLITIAVLHKHRYIVTRRFLCMVGTLYLLRDATILVTSLPECGQGIPCIKEEGRTNWIRAKIAFQTFIKLGMTSTGGRLCGAYIFSGHAMMLTVVCLFITEYSTKKYYSLHVVTWLLGFVGMLCILASHGHYTVDVILGFYITYSMFVHYHALASSPSLRRHYKWTKIWFPMLFFLESNVRGFIPNEYEWPLPLPMRFKQLF